MAIGPVELNGVISRTQDYSTLKQNEDNKGMINQQNFQNSFEKEVETRSQQVNKQDETRREERKFDAKEKGDNEYAGNGGKGKNKEKEKKNTGGKVVVKGHSSFDIKI